MPIRHLSQLADAAGRPARRCSNHSPAFRRAEDRQCQSDQTSFTSVQFVQETLLLLEPELTRVFGDAEELALFGPLL
jgi:hypothetical protein